LSAAPGADSLQHTPLLLISSVYQSSAKSHGRRGAHLTPPNFCGWPFLSMGHLRQDVLFVQ